MAAWSVAEEWPTTYLPLVGSDHYGDDEARREQRERIVDLVPGGYDRAAHTIHLEITDDQRGGLEPHLDALRRRFARAGVPQDELVPWVVPARLARYRGAIARIVPTECVTVRAHDDATVHCPAP